MPLPPPVTMTGLSLNPRIPAMNLPKDKFAKSGDGTARQSARPSRTTPRVRRGDCAQGLSNTR